MNRIRSYRLIEGANQTAVGKLLGISTQSVSAVEQGTRSLSVSLAPLGYGNRRFEVPPMTEPLHRQKAMTKVSSTARAKELLRLGGEVFAELRAELPKRPSVTLEPMGSPMTDQEVDEMANDVRCGLLGHEESGPINNLTRAVEQAGVCLVPIVGLEGIDGISSWVDGQSVVGLSVAVPGDRFRFSLAHEIGHLVMHHRKGEETERQANRFASSLLVPPGDFIVALPKNPMLRDFVNLKSVWGLSVAALVYKAHELDLIDDSRYRALQIQMSKWRRTEPGEFEPVVGRALPAIVAQDGGVEAVAARLEVNQYHLGEVSNWGHLRTVSLHDGLRVV